MQTHPADFYKHRRKLTQEVQTYRGPKRASCKAFLQRASGMEKPALDPSSVAALAWASLLVVPGWHDKLAVAEAHKE
ncbi:hypothetical protein WJX73_002368 [Symbiochloris irregularis]|uniref:Uncharacterized protein n=1 Tax=Symbiochloris irregularis TaxID=706552 RepID=A0AAW1NT13_9CHLO